MSIFKGDIYEVTRYEQQLRDQAGRFRKRECPECGDPLVMEKHADGSITWRCDGLVDPNDDSKPLEACLYETRSGDEDER